MGVVDSKILEVEPVSHPVPNPLVIDHMAHLKHVWMMIMIMTMMMMISLGSHDRLGSIPAKPGGHSTRFVSAELSECIWCEVIDLLHHSEMVDLLHHSGPTL